MNQKMRLVKQLALVLAAAMLLPFSTSRAEDLSGMKLAVIPQCKVQDHEVGYTRVCAELLSPEEIDEVKSMQFDEVLTYKAVQDGLILAAQLKKSDLGFYDRPAIAGEFSTFLEPIDTHIYAIKVRFKGIEKAMLNLLLFNLATQKPIKLNIDGRDYSERTVVESWPVVLQKLEKNSARYDVMYFPSVKHREEKKVWVFRGRHCLTTISGCNVIYTADGAIQTFIVNADAVGISLDAFVFVGIQASDTNRIGELLKGYDQNSFDAFLRFVVTDLAEAVEHGSKPKSRYAAGYSNGGAWALDALLLHPEFFDGAIAMSPATWELKSKVNLHQKKIFLGAGELEPGFFKQTEKYEEIVQDLGAQVETCYSKSGHTMNTWVPIWNMALKHLNEN